MEKEKTPNFITPERTMRDATRVFEFIIKNNELGNIRMADQKSKVTLGMMNEPKALLPSWVMRSEEICVTLFGQRLWNVKYQGDLSSLLGYSLQDIKKDEENKHEVRKDLPFSLIYLICQQALSDRISVNLQDKTYTPKTEMGYFFGVKEIKEHGDVFEFNSERNIVAFEINKIMTNIAKEHRYIRELKLSNSEQLEQGTQVKEN